MKGYNMSDYKNINETNIFEKIVAIVQNAVNAFEIFQSEYTGFIDNEKADANVVIDCLNNVRMYKKIVSLSDGIIRKNNIRLNDDKISVFSKSNLLKELKDIQLSAGEIQEKYQKIFNESVDIEDEDEYQRVQREARQKRKIFKELNEFCIGLCEIIENYTPINFTDTTNQSIEDIKEEQVNDVTSNPDLPLEQPVSLSNIVKIVDFNNPNAYTGFKPTYFTYGNKRYDAGSWKKVYTKFIGILYSNSNFTQILRSYIGESFSSKKSNHPDFADTKLVKTMRVPYKIGKDFFIETNFSTSDIIKRLKSIMLICNIRPDSLRIEYTEKPETTEPDTPMEFSETIAEEVKPKTYTETPAVVHEETRPSATVSVTQNKPDENKKLNIASSKPFVLEDAVISLLSSEDITVQEQRGYNNGLNKESLQMLIKKFYNQNVETYDIAMVLLKNPACKSVGMACYIVNKDMLSDNKPEEIQIVEPKKTESTDYGNFSSVEKESSDIEQCIVEILKSNKDNVYYQDGFDSYMIKNLMPHEYANTVTLDKIEDILNTSKHIKKIEDDYFIYNEDAEINNISAETAPVYTDDKNITLILNNKEYTSYDYTDALVQICEFVIRSKPFKMAYIGSSKITLNGKPVFYRCPAPVEDYKRLSNGLQLMRVKCCSDVMEVAEKVIEYCHIDRNLVRIKSE